MSTELQLQARQLEERQFVRIDRRLARAELFQFKLRSLGTYVAAGLSLINSAGAVVLVMQGMALPLGLGLVGLASACAGAAFAIATGLPVKPEDFVRLLAAGRELTVTNAKRGGDETGTDDET